MLPSVSLVFVALTSSVSPNALRAERAERPLGVSAPIEALPPPPPPPYRAYVAVTAGPVIGGPGVALDVDGRLGVTRWGAQLGVRVSGVWGLRDTLGLGDVSVNAVRLVAELGYCRRLIRVLDGCARVGGGYEWAWGQIEGERVFQERTRQDGSVIGVATLGARVRLGSTLRVYLTVDGQWRTVPPRFSVEGLSEETSLPRFDLRPALGAEVIFF